MQVLLINPGFEIKKLKIRDNYVFPFGLAYVARYAENRDHKFEIWDIHASQTEFKQILLEIEKMDFSKFDIIGITGIVDQYLYVKKFTKHLKKFTDIPIILGGPLASYSWEIVLQTSLVDICVIGEGEQTFLDILNKKPINDIDGIIYKKNGKIIKNSEREQIKNIDSIGFPAFHLFNMEFYFSHSGMVDILRPYYKNRKKLALITSRGCPYNCNFCSKSTKGIRMKSLDFLFKEIDFYIKSLKVKALHFVDELLLLNKKRFIEFCNRIKKYNVPWDCQARINLANFQLLKLMKESNCACVGFGIESGSQKILDKMNKRIKVQDTIKILKYCIKIHLPVKIQLIFGYPGESWDTLNETINLFKKVRLPGRRASPITPMPGAPLYEIAKNDGFIGDKKSDKITEENYLKFLSLNGGWVNSKLFYNRTEFDDKNFYRIMNIVDNRIFYQFLLMFFIHPIFIIKNWSYYLIYLKNWRRHKERLYIFNLPELIARNIRNPKKMFKKLILLKNIKN